MTATQNLNYDIHIGFSAMAAETRLFVRLGAEILNFIPHID